MESDGKDLNSLNTQWPILAIPFLYANICLLIENGSVKKME